MNRFLISLLGILVFSLSAMADTKVVFEVASGIKTPITVNTGDGAIKVNSTKTLDHWTRVDDAYDADGNAIVVPLSHSKKVGSTTYETYTFETLYSHSASSSKSGVAVREKPSKEERREKRERQAQQRLEWFENNNFQLSQEVDLGLPSGNIWAGYDLGAMSPMESGTFTTWQPNDVVAEDWGDGWQTPTKADYEELVNYCEWECIGKGKINGYRGTGPNGNKIFFLANGHYPYGDGDWYDGYSIYLTKNLCEEGESDFNEYLGMPVIFGSYYFKEDKVMGYGLTYTQKNAKGNIRPVYKER